MARGKKLPEEKLQGLTSQMIYGNQLYIIQLFFMQIQGLTVIVFISSIVSGSSNEFEYCSSFFI